MKIFMITASDISRSEGPVIHLMELAQQLCRNGVSVTVFAPRLGPYPEKTDVAIRYIPVVKLLRMTRTSYVITLFFYLTKALLTGKPDLLYTRGSYYTFVPPVLSRVFRLPHVSEINGILLDDLERNRRSFLVKGVVRLVERFSYRVSACTIVLTNGMKRRLGELYALPGRSMTVIPVAANPHTFFPVPKAAARDAVKLTKSGYYVGFLGTLDKWQGLKTLIDALLLIREELPAVVCLIAGRGELKETLTQEIARRNLTDCCMFVGAIPHREAKYYINACDVLVIPREYNPLGFSPIKLFEYMSCGRPVVASRVPGFEMLEDGEAVVLVMPGDSRALASAVIALLRDEHRREAMGRNGRRLVEQRYNWDAVAKQVKEVLRSAVEKSDD